MLAYNEKAAGLRSSIKLSNRERAVLTDLYHGLSRVEIAVKQTLSVNTVNSTVNSIFNKLGAHNIVDAVRIANEEELF
jgi:DNA-binding NarL/FixJ family response regulator